MQVVNLQPSQFLQPDRPTSMGHNQGGNVASVEVDLKRHKKAGQSLLGLFLAFPLGVDSIYRAAHLNRWP